MEKVIYNICGVRTSDFSKKEELERTLNTKAIMEFEEIPEPSTPLTPIRKAMLEQFGYVSRKLLSKVVVP